MDRTDREREAARGAAALILGVLVVRVAQLFLSPLELYPDEAQYWLWSRHLDWGYFSKPPVIAWVIRLSTALGGNREAWVRLPAPVLHAVAAGALFAAGRRLFDAATGLRAAAVYLLMPGVALSSQVIATDAPLLAALGLALWALCALWRRPPCGGLALAVAAGAALGAAALSKYAALYVVAGLAIHAAVDAQGRRRLWTAPRAAATTAAFLLVVAPNLVWNALHGFQTVAHTAADADLKPVDRNGIGLHLGGAAGFVVEQFGVFGPAPFAALIAAGAVWVRRRAAAEERWLLHLTAPALAVVLAEALAARANANWAGAAYAAGALLAARAPTWGRGWRLALTSSLALQAALAAAFTVAMVQPALVEAVGLGNSLKRAQGWAATALAARRWRDEAATEGAVSALAVDDRFVFNALAYYGRSWIAAPGAPPLRMWVRERRPRNQAETTAPLAAAQGARVAFVSTDYAAETRADFRSVGPQAQAAATLGGGRTRPLSLFVGVGFAPRPRDLVSGRPISP